MEPTFTLEQFLAVTNKLSIAELALTECKQELAVKADYVANLERKNSKLIEENIALKQKQSNQMSEADYLNEAF